MHVRTSARAALAAALAFSALPLAGAAPAIATTVSAYEGLPDGTRQKKSLVIGIDGATFATFGSFDLPSIELLMAQGMTATGNLYAAPMSDTWSGPGWATVATGVWPDKHLAKDNSFSGADFTRYPDYQTRLESADPTASTLVVGTWPSITSTIFTMADVRKAGTSDDDTTAQAADYLAHGNPDSVFVHLDDVDHAGHDHGAASLEYRAALEATDARIGEILKAVTSRPTYADEDWQIILTTDHGHTDAGGHGGDSPQERQTFVIAKGSGHAAGSIRNDVKLTDIAPTVLAHEGVAASPSWELDGTPVHDIAADAFDGLRPSLKPRVDETSLSTSVKGWTTTAPAGWRVDSSKMPTGGTTEWRGWSFTTDEFWSNTDRGQGRETNVRARNVFAVADSDEWDDKDHGTGQFDSTLISPSYGVPADRTVEIRYATNYKIDGPQTGDVYVSWDNGTPRLITSYRADVNTVERLPVTAPAGAKTFKLRFRYTGTNSAFWSVDQVRVSG
ncbi:alkaline phosphatase family protein [Streptomyces sp. NBC_00094]|uniref:alkaline phosphatase family protein n=1 Tax=Streptomyces sp. NBC_00094 TaxID=2903620 RepID=UPI00224F1D77|nr:alkaline phosphatase family protein [Streptomyces sp. NBC_00094]MCX5394446.1 alkaline phosphatase family protein [Streptomyces sp. NBC_00094]